MTGQQIDLSKPIQQDVILDAVTDPVRGMKAYLYFVVATILLFVSPALVIAVWRWVL